MVDRWDYLSQYEREVRFEAGKWGVDKRAEGVKEAWESIEERCIYTRL
jgi:hypothetical protein